MKTVARSSRAGFTLLELLLALALVVIIAIKAHGAMESATKTATQTTSDVILEDQARRVLRQIAYSVMGSNRETLIPTEQAPFFTDDLRYQVNLGVQDGQVVWSDPEEVAMEEAALEIHWSQNPDSEEQRRVTWTRLVTPFLEGEVPNGIDDNGNGLIDEQGLSFVIDKNAIKIYLTLQRTTSDGEVITKTVDTVVTCRNLGSAE